MGSGHLVNNSRLLKNLNTYIKEDQLLSSISQLSNEVNKIESASGRSLHTIKMRSEIAKLEDLLSYTKNQTNLRAQQFHKTKSEE
jgi:t-SNARE complex subunit (syntaxin)